MKKGYHSTQQKYFNTVPRSAFLGLVLGYGIGLLVSGLMHTTSSAPHWIGTIVGAGIGFWIDDKYFLEKDVPVEEIEAQDSEESEQDNDSEIEASEQDTESDAADSDADDSDTDDSDD